MTLGNKIQLIREEHSLSQKELADFVGVTTGTVAEWEADESVPTLAELSHLSKALNVSADILLDVTTENSNKTSDATPIQVSAPVIASAKKRKKYGWVIGSVAVLFIIALVFLVIKLLPFSNNSAAIEAADASVVTIFCYDHEGKLTATASGFVAFDSKTIITNYHVMTDAYTCKISTNQDISYEASTILRYSEEQDIAILQLAEDTKLQPLTLGDSSIIKKGETVVAIGSPLGIKNTVSTGVLSGRLTEDNMDFLQFTAPISSGSSGGALFDNNGDVIGITCASYIDGQNLNLAVPIELAIQLYKSNGIPKNISAIFDEKYPYIRVLEKYKNTQQVTVTQLKENPEQFDDKRILLHAVVCSDDEFFYVVDKEYYDPDQYKQPARAAHGKFDNNPYLYVIRGVECEYDPDEIIVGEEVVIIGNFCYEAVGEEYKGVKNGKISTLIRKVNYAELRALVVHQP